MGAFHSCTKFYGYIVLNIRESMALSWLVGFRAPILSSIQMNKSSIADAIKYRLLCNDNACNDTMCRLKKHKLKELGVSAACWLGTSVRCTTIQTRIVIIHTHICLERQSTCEHVLKEGISLMLANNEKYLQ